MAKYKVGVLCPSEIAFRRFVPSVKEQDTFEYVGVAVANKEEWKETVEDESKIDGIIESEIKKAQNFADNYGGKIFSGYSELINSDEIDCVYLPLPPALHYRWGRQVLLGGRHLLMEKPFTDSLKKTEELVSIARKNNLALHENYMFIYHSQLEYIDKLLDSGEIGSLRNIRASFTFPMRQANDFRYNKALGGGALLDCAGYPIRLVTHLLKKDASLEYSRLNYIENYDVDFYGTAVMAADGVCAEITFGMDNSYKCELEIQGSKGLIYTGRIFTAPAGFKPTVTVNIGGEEKTVELSADNSFLKSIGRFAASIEDTEKREEMFEDIINQAQIIEQIKG